ncbi:MAG: hypothetical protein JXX29_17605 [Deltaproteobacteria bacterium]|nr:hypothetical protein [Deltaproteobacteria bacterium]MBN2673501.1 hypothetical protein [Deltaproteobacteria bacterium]
MKSLRKILFVALLAIGLFGCGSVKPLAIESASQYLNCPEEELTAEWIDARTYRVTGCAASGVFVCSKLKNKCKYDSVLN